MHDISSGWEDTIAAIATPPGIAAIGVLRLSGNNSFDIIQKIFPSKNLKIQSANTLHVGYLIENKNVLDEVVISLFKKPHSYTGEDVIEISCHGSPFVQQQVLESVLRNGARLAKAGEFTQRAFLNKKLDLVQAEAIGDLISSNTKASQNAALKNMRGGFSNMLLELREELIKFSSLIELELDFSEEDVEFADRHKFLLLIEDISETINKLIQSFKLGNVIKNGISVAIVGKPNTGKSTLLNALLNENRAIVSEIAGTTRDTIEEVININGILFRLIDTAGIREHSQDIIENMGVIKSREKIKTADIVLYLFDVNDINADELAKIINEIRDQNSLVITVGNKTDIYNEQLLAQFATNLFISAKEGTGLNELKRALFVMAGGEQINNENVVVTNARHYAALTEVAKSLREVKKGLLNHISGDLLSIDINRSLHYLGEITGKITNENRLDYIFSKFCIGK
ncbi:MAG: tRNA uridine-5-carboxymethylaminomethyl(34) synthesis GTPase MnmE [Bacteroidota bacterium]|nr:tRNA uridine-5-carboxymethylaminomethyl(34) synthesis GTPase MnmE [Bacteroidota bacterium]